MKRCKWTYNINFTKKPEELDETDVNNIKLTILSEIDFLSLEEITIIRSLGIMAKSKAIWMEHYRPT